MMTMEPTVAANNHVKTYFSEDDAPNGDILPALLPDCVAAGGRVFVLVDVVSLTGGIMPVPPVVV